MGEAEAEPEEAQQEGDWLAGRGLHGSRCQQAEHGVRATHRYSSKLESHLSGGAALTPLLLGVRGKHPLSEQSEGRVCRAATWQARHPRRDGQ